MTCKTKMRTVLTLGFLAELRWLPLCFFSAIQPPNFFLCSG